MSVQPFLFEPTYPPGEEPSDSQGEEEGEGGELDENGSRIGSTQWCICMALNLRQKSSFIFNIQVFILNVMFTI